MAKDRQDTYSLLEERARKAKLSKEKEKAMREIEEEIAKLQEEVNKYQLSEEEEERASSLFKALYVTFPDLDIDEAFKKSSYSAKDKKLIATWEARNAREAEVGFLRYKLLHLLLEDEIKARTKRDTVTNRDIIDFVEYLTEEVKKEELKKRAIAIPSHAGISPLLRLFNGKKNLRSRSTLFEEEIEYRSDGRGGLAKETVRTAIISDSPVVRAKVHLEGTLFSGDIVEEQEELACYLDKTYGPEGKRHLLGLMIGLEEAGRTGVLEWNVNEHLERLDYSRGPNRAFKTKDREKARRIMFLLGTLAYTVENRKKEHTTIEADRFFNIEGFKVEKEKEWIVDETIKISATQWYRRSFMIGQRSKEYTKVLRDIAQESHRDHEITIALAPELAVDWRRTPSKEKRAKVRTLLEVLDIRIGGKRFRENIRKLEAELDYMKTKNYLGEWATKSGRRPSEAPNDKELLEEVIIFRPPEWLSEEFAKIKKGTDLPRLKAKRETPPMSTEEFVKILKQSGLTQKEFAKEIGISPSYVSQIKKGRPISSEVAESAREIFGEA